MADYRWEVSPSNPAAIQELQDAASVSRPTAIALISRGIGPEKVHEFLQPSLKSLVDPYRLPGTKEAAARLWQAIQNGETILIHGDYDADGITSTVLMTQILTENGAKVDTFLPHRIDDGYGLTPESIKRACEKQHSLLLTVDCGITSDDAVRTARGLGIDVIVTDHHEPGEALPVASAVIDPKLPGADPRIRELAGVGVAFKVCHAFVKYGRENRLGGYATDLRDVLDLVALGTVADIVPLVEENRPLVKYGLQVLSRQHRPGIRALCDIAGLNEAIRAPDIAFRLAPRLNASGRLGDPTLSMDLLMAQSMSVAFPLAKALDDENRKRQELEAETFEQAEEQIAARCNLDTDRTVVVWGEKWHQGVLGIVAARLTRRHHRPCVVLTRDVSGFFSGSGRSVGEVNLVQMLEKCEKVLGRYGGHPMAAGLSLLVEDLEGFAAKFEKAVQGVLPLDQMRPQLTACGEISFSEIDDVFLEELKLVEPFGQGNPEPVFLTRMVTPNRVHTVGRGHARGYFRDGTDTGMNFIAFGQLPESFPEPPWDVVYKPHLNTYGGHSTPQAQVLDVRPAE